jgi:hypothetical protein
VSCEVHAGFCERRGVRLPPATHLVLNEATDPQMAGVAPTPTDPIAYFEANRYGEKVGIADIFTAIPGPVSARAWRWSFGDHTTGHGPRVTHVYSRPGVYTVTLTETGPGGTSRYSASVHVVAAHADANTVCGQVDNRAEYVPGDDTLEFRRFLLI